MINNENISKNDAETIKFNKAQLEDIYIFVDSKRFESGYFFQRLLIKLMRNIDREEFGLPQLDYEVEEIKFLIQQSDFIKYCVDLHIKGEFDAMETEIKRQGYKLPINTPLIHEKNESLW